MINGFRFFRNKKRGHLQYWKCRNYYKERCPAIAIHDESTLILRLCHQHQHTESNDIEIKPLPGGSSGDTNLAEGVEWHGREDEADDVVAGPENAPQPMPPPPREPPPLVELKAKPDNSEF